MSTSIDSLKRDTGLISSEKLKACLLMMMMMMMMDNADVSDNGKDYDDDDDDEEGDNDDKTAPSMSTLTNNIINFSINSHS